MKIKLTFPPKWFANVPCLKNHTTKVVVILSKLKKRGSVG